MGAALKSKNKQTKTFESPRNFIIILFIFCHFVASGSSQAMSRIRYSCQTTPQPQQHQIQAASETYTTAQEHAEFLTHGVRSGIQS